MLILLLYASKISLIDKDFLADIQIECITLKHPYDSAYKKFSYKEEIDYLTSSVERNSFLTNLVSSLKGNTLVLYQLVEGHGKVLYDMINSKNKDVHFIFGGIKTDERERIRNKVIKSTDNIIVASYGTYSTGVNIPNLNNIVFSSPSKSRIRNLQSIGRGLRKTEDKSDIKVFDIYMCIMNY